VSKDRLCIPKMASTMCPTWVIETVPKTTLSGVCTVNTSLTKIGFSIVVLLTCTGCGTWKDDNQFSNPVWAIGETQMAAVYETFESKPNFWSLGSVNQTRNFHTQLVVKTIDPKAPGTLTKSHFVGPKIKGRSRRVWAMKDYFLVQTEGEAMLAKPEGSSARVQAWTRISKSGASKTLYTGKRMTMLSCDGGQSSSSLPMEALGLMPSPDSKQLALIQGSADCQSASVEIQVLDAYTFKALTPNHSIKLSQLNGGFFASMGTFWSSDSGSLYLGQTLGPMSKTPSGYRLDVASGKLFTVDNLTPECIWQTHAGNDYMSKTHGALNLSSDGSLKVELNPAGGLGAGGFGTDTCDL